MKTKLAFVVAMAVSAGISLLALPGFGQTKDSPPKIDKKDPTPRSNQVLMHNKLVHASKVLDGLSVEDYGKIAESAEMMRIISRAASWHAITTDEYFRHSKNFQEQSAVLVAMPRRKISKRRHSIICESLSRVFNATSTFARFRRTKSGNRLMSRFGGL